MAPNSPLVSPLIPSVKKRVLGLPLEPTCPEAEGPKAPWRVADANVNRDRALEHPGCEIEGVNLAVGEAEIADQQVASELTKTVRCQGDAPRRGEGAAKDRLQQCPSLGEKRHCARPRSGRSPGLQLLTAHKSRPDSRC